MRALILLALAGCAAGHPSTAPTRHGAGSAPPRSEDPTASASVALLPGTDSRGRPLGDDGADGAGSAPAADEDPGSELADLTELLQPVREEHGIPGLAALVLRGDDIAAQGAVGVRRVDGEHAVTLEDRWHLGSCTKSMTATLAAVLVAQDALAWDTTIGATFPDVPMHDDWRDVTLAMLLTNSSGAPTGLSKDGLWARLWERVGTPVEQRRTLLRGVLAHAPAAAPGTKYIYSNAGFSIAGAMLESVTDTPFEELLTTELFDPLAMSRAAFGAPGDRESKAPTDPLGHKMRRGELQPTELGFGDDNPPGIAPAGLVHSPLTEWARYAALHLNAARGEPLPEPFSRLDFRTLHTPRVGGYAMGWAVSEPDWCDGRLLWHNGSNTMWYCELALFPDADLAILVAANTAHGTTRQASGGVVRALYERFAAAEEDSNASGEPVTGR